MMPLLPLVLLDKLDDFLVHLLRLGLHGIVEVGTVEGALKLWRVVDAQAPLDVRAHLVGRRGRQGYDGCRAYLVDGVADFAVFGSEIVSPLRDTMGFVNGIESDVDGFEELDILLLVQGLRAT